MAVTMVQQVLIRIFVHKTIRGLIVRIVAPREKSVFYFNACCRMSFIRTPTIASLVFRSGVPCSLFPSTPLLSPPAPPRVRPPRAPSGSRPRTATYEKEARGRPCSPSPPPRRSARGGSASSPHARSRP